jgi:hypothetical protein
VVPIIFFFYKNVTSSTDQLSDLKTSTLWRKSTSVGQEQKFEPFPSLRVIYTSDFRSLTHFESYTIMRGVKMTFCVQG